MEAAGRKEDAAAGAAPGPLPGQQSQVATAFLSEAAMRSSVTVVLALCILGQSLVLAAEPPDATSAASPGQTTSPPSQQPRLREAIAREATQSALSLVRGEGSLVQQPGSADRGWIARHPALFGALVGAGAGAVSAVTMENELFCSGGDEDCFFHGDGRVLVGAGFGAGIGALVGFLVGLGG